jgi:hypothetical protein
MKKPLFPNTPRRIVIDLTKDVEEPGFPIPIPFPNIVIDLITDSENDETDIENE